MLTDPAQSRFLSQRFFQNRTGVDITFSFASGKLFLDFIFQCAMPFDKHVMVILVKCIKRNVAPVRVVSERHIFFSGQVIRAQANDCLHSGKDLIQVRALLGIATHIAHPALIIPVEPLLIPFHRLSHMRSSYAEPIEPQLAGKLFDKNRFFTN